jgi:hypothetical protein
MYHGDFPLSGMVDFNFQTNKADGTPITLSGSPVVAAYKANSTTQSVGNSGTTGTAGADGVGLTVDFDGVTGLHHVRINLATNTTFFSSGGDFSVVLTAGTVDSISVVGSIVGSFSIERATADIRKVLGVAPSLPTTIDANVVTVAADALTGSALATSAVTEIQAGLATSAGLTSAVAPLATSAALATVQADTDDLQTRAADIQSRIPTALGTGGNMKADLRSGAAGVIDSAMIADNAIDAAALAADVATELQAGLTFPTTADIVNAIKAYMVDKRLPFDAVMKLLATALVGKATGMGTGAPALSSADLDPTSTSVAGSKTRIAVVGADVYGNKPIVNVDVTDIP